MRRHSDVYFDWNREWWSSWMIKLGSDCPRFFPVCVYRRTYLVCLDFVEKSDHLIRVVDPWIGFSLLSAYFIWLSFSLYYFDTMLFFEDPKGCTPAKNERNHECNDVCVPRIGPSILSDLWSSFICMRMQTIFYWTLIARSVSRFLDKNPNSRLAAAANAAAAATPRQPPQVPIELTPEQVLWFHSFPINSLRHSWEK